jgi:hypothetical protein
MTDDPQLIDMARLRSKLLVAQERARRGDGDVQAPIDEAIAMLNPRLDPDASHPDADHDVIRKAMEAAHEQLLAGGLVNPAEILIVQTHDENGRTTSRTAGSSIANPQDILRLVLRNIERALQADKKSA